MRRILIRTLSIILVIFILLSIISTGMNAIFYSPDCTSDFNTLGILIESLSPYTQCTYQRKDLELPHIFSFYRHHVFLQKIMNENGKNLFLEEHRTIDFFLGKIYSTAVLEPGDNQGVILRQRNFADNELYREQKYILDDAQYYEALIALQEPLSLQTIVEKYSDLFQTTQRYFRQEESEENKRYQGGIIWIGIETSENSNDICLGVAGPYSAHFFDRNASIDTSSNELDALYKKYELLFSETMEILSQKNDEANMFLEDFMGVGSISFQDRLSYAYKHQYPCCGFTVYLRGDALKDFLNNEELVLVEYYQKEAAGIEEDNTRLSNS